jgi:hypothetical protein
MCDIGFWQGPCRRLGSAYPCQEALAASPKPPTARGHGRRRRMVEQGDRVQHEPSKLVGAYDAFSSLQIVCAWCQQPIRWHRVQTPVPLQPSHGICPACLGHVSSARRVMTPATPQTTYEPCVAWRDGHAGEQSRTRLSADTPASPVHEAPLPASEEALLQRIRDTRLQARVIHAAARATCQRARERREDARHSSTMACVACVVCRYLITQRHRHAEVRSTKRGGHSTSQTRCSETCTRASVPRERKGER